jgi:hypothetical protein
MENIFWSGYSNNERHQTINSIKEAISESGDIVDFHFFSDIGIAIKIEIEEWKINYLHEKLMKVIKLDKEENVTENSKRERVIFLNLTFGKGTGNLTVESPAVPG